MSVWLEDVGGFAWKPATPPWMFSVQQYTGDYALGWPYARKGFVWEHVTYTKKMFFYLNTNISTCSLCVNSIDMASWSFQYSEVNSNPSLVISAASKFSQCHHQCAWLLGINLPERSSKVTPVHSISCGRLGFVMGDAANRQSWNAIVRCSNARQFAMFIQMFTWHRQTNTFVLVTNAKSHTHIVYVFLNSQCFDFNRISDGYRSCIKRWFGGCPFWTGRDDGLLFSSAHVPSLQVGPPCSLSYIVIANMVVSQVLKP